MAGISAERFSITKRRLRSRLKIKILVQFQDRAEIQVGGIHWYVEELKRGPNPPSAEKWAKRFFKIASNKLKMTVGCVRVPFISLVPW